MTKKILVIICLISRLSPLFGQSKLSELPWIGFNWKSGNINGHYFDKLAITVPIQIEDIPQTFEMQFDLGSNLTMFFENTMIPYFEKYAYLKDKRYVEDGFPWITNTKIILNGIVFNNKKVFIKAKYGEMLTSDSIKTNKVRRIGTIGADFVQNKILVIDYKNKRLCILDTLDSKIEKKVSFISYKADSQGRIILPFVIDGSDCNVLFDTGASIFVFASTKKSWASFCDTTKIAKLDSIRSWGQYLEFWESPLKNDLSIKGTGITINNAKLSFPNPTPEKYEEFLLNSGIIGITGNTLFLENCIFVDFKNKKFGILK